ncbi:hypothetical protein [Parapedobacter koreensis]|uniref:Uncharacterized protein n=1 Tax=Parapedobacter koreensis TaxID=332977 RepID=A0A1H7PUE7_9SPHI|nr:hypothetical protein [Parapedobacter koreensis]SEL38865.1 hypothetical protein SAMN05421740_1053 [Parapedobacter koreensis]
MSVIKDVNRCVYRFYPKNLSLYDEGYYKSQEYLDRRAMVDEAFHQNAGWISFKALIEEIMIDRSSPKADYSFGGGMTSYHLSIDPKAFGLDSERNMLVFTVLISVISDFWAFRFMEKTSDGWSARYTTKNETEEALVRAVSGLVKKCFPEHEKLPEGIHQLTVNDVYMRYAEESGATVFELLFTDHDN